MSADACVTAYGDGRVTAIDAVRFPTLTGGFATTSNATSLPLVIVGSVQRTKSVCGAQSAPLAETNVKRGQNEMSAVTPLASPAAACRTSTCNTTLPDASVSLMFGA